MKKQLSVEYLRSWVIPKNQKRKAEEDIDCPQPTPPSTEVYKEDQFTHHQSASVCPSDMTMESPRSKDNQGGLLTEHQFNTKDCLTDEARAILDYLNNGVFQAMQEFDTSISNAAEDDQHYLKQHSDLIPQLDGDSAPKGNLDLITQALTWKTNTNRETGPLCQEFCGTFKDS